MKKYSLWFAIFLLLTLLAGCADPVDKPTVDPSPVVSTPVENDLQVEGNSNNQPDAVLEEVEEVTEQWTEVKFNSLENVFGFADEAGQRLITLENSDGTELVNPEQFNVAVGNNGDRVEIEFVLHQDANNLDDNRQTMYNFDNMAGYIYKVKEGTLVQNKSYMLVRDGVIDEKTLVHLKSTIDESSPVGQYPQVDTETIKKIESIKDRKITSSSVLSESTKEKIALFVFERQGEDMLASIAYISKDTAVFKDFPAKYNEYGTWRVDSGDDPGLFEVMFLAQSDEGLLLGLTWAAPEGENLFVLRQEDDIFLDTDLQAGRYWSPK